MNTKNKIGFVDELCDQIEVIYVKDAPDYIDLLRSGEKQGRIITSSWDLIDKYVRELIEENKK